MYNGMDLTSGPCQSKPNLFATQCLFQFINNEELAENEKGTLDPARIAIPHGKPLDQI